MAGRDAVFDTERGMANDQMEMIDVDDDGRTKRTGTVWSATAHIVTAVIGSGVLSLPWCVAQLGWIGGSVALLYFSFVTYYTASLLADCYRSPHPVTGQRNYTYMEAVRANLGGIRTMLCGITQYIIIIGTTIAYTITAAISMVAIQKSNCYHKQGHGAKCEASTNIYMISFGIVQIVLSQIPNIHELSWLSTVAAVMSFSYSIIGVALSMGKIISGKTGKTSILGVDVGPQLSEAQKVWNILVALGNIALAYSFALILIEIQDTLKPPAENKKMKKANVLGVSVTTVFYLLCGFLGYAAFGNDAPGNMLTGFGFYEPFWLIDFANVCIVVHLVGAVQVFSQPFFSAFETWASKEWNKSKFVTAEYTKYNINLFRLIWRTCYVLVTLGVAMSVPFFNQVIGLLGAAAYWPLTVYFPISMYISQQKLQRFSLKWTGLQFINLSCLLVALAAACGSIQGIIKAF